MFVYSFDCGIPLRFIYSVFICGLFIITMSVSDEVNSDVDYEPIGSEDEMIESYESDDFDLSEPNSRDFDQLRTIFTGL